MQLGITAQVKERRVLVRNPGGGWQSKSGVPHKLADGYHHDSDGYHLTWHSLFLSSLPHPTFRAHGGTALQTVLISMSSWVAILNCFYFIFNVNCSLFVVNHPESCEFREGWYINLNNKQTNNPFGSLPYLSVYLICPWGHRKLVCIYALKLMLYKETESKSTFAVFYYSLSIKAHVVTSLS